MSNAPDETSRREGRSPWRAIGLLFLIYLLTRTVSLTLLPIFLDEAVHIQWSERLYAEGRILRPVGSGRLLAVATYGLALPSSDRLWAARMIAVLVGALTLLGTTLLSSRLFGKRAGVVAGLLYVFSPFALVYDRLALSDGFLSASITALMFSTWAVAHKRRPGVGGAALLVVLAVASKVSALLFLATLPLGVLTLPRERFPALRALAVAGMVGLLCASPILWFFVSNSGEISSQHLVDPAQAASQIVSTLTDMREWVTSYFGIPIMLAAALSLILIRDGRAVWLLASWAAPFVLFALFSQPWSARYVLPTLPPILILIAGGIEALAVRMKSGSVGVALGLTALVSLPGLAFDRQLLLDPARAPFPEDDRRQLVTDWPSGYGVRELAARVKREALAGPITAYVDSGGLRTVPTSLSILLGRDPAISLVEGDFGSLDFRGVMSSAAESRRIFAIAGPRFPPLDLASAMPRTAIKPVEVFSRPGGEWAATLYSLGPSGEAKSPETQPS